MRNKEVLYRAGAIILALALWSLLAKVLDNKLLLVSPWATLEKLAHLVRDGQFWATVAYSLLRIMAGYLLAVAAGAVMGFIAGRVKAVEILLWPYVSAVKAVPVASFIILCLIWLDFTSLTILISFLIVFPVIYSNVLNGVRAVRPQMTEMANLYKVPWTRRFLYIELPAVKPYLLSAAGVAVGMAWKAGVAAEVIGVVQGSVGGKLYDAKVYFETADLFAWTLVIIVVSVLLEKFIRFLLESGFKGVEKL